MCLFFLRMITTMAFIVTIVALPARAAESGSGIGSLAADALKKTNSEVPRRKPKPQRRPNLQENWDREPGKNDVMEGRVPSSVLNSAGRGAQADPSPSTRGFSDQTQYRNSRRAASNSQLQSPRQGHRVQRSFDTSPNRQAPGLRRDPCVGVDYMSMNPRSCAMGW